MEFLSKAIFKEREETDNEVFDIQKEYMNACEELEDARHKFNNADSNMVDAAIKEIMAKEARCDALYKLIK